MESEIVYGKRKSRLWIYGIFFLCFIFLILFGYYLFALYFPPSSGENAILFDIMEGQSSAEISKNLKKQGIIRDPNVFEFYAWKRGLDDRLQVGPHELQTSFNMKQVLETLTSVKRKQENEFTIIEGWNNKEIASYFEKNGMMSLENFDLQTKKKLDWWDSYDFLIEKPKDVDLEGYLFPDTYRVFENATSEDIIRKMLDNFGKKFTTEIRAEIAKSQKTIHEVVTLASIVEKEVRTDEERKKVAGIFYKRLELGIALQADSTVNYATGKSVAAASAEDLKIESLYNTYKYRGLPPGPISNPGLSSIMAAIRPESSDYLYFLTTPEGEVIYSKTFDEHVENKRKYLR